MERATIAGVLLNYRDAARSIICIRSLFAQDIFHIVVWDNSADGGESAAQIRVAFDADPRVIIEISPANLGFGAGVNRALQACMRQFDAAWVVLINNDATLRNGAVKALMQASREHPDAVLISMDIQHAGHRQGRLHYQRWTGLQFAHAVLGSFPYASGCCLWLDVKRTPSPLFDESFFMYGEDCELAWRVSKDPGAWVHLSKLLVNHEGSASSGLGSLFYETQVVVAHLLLARKLARNFFEMSLFTMLRVPVLMTRAAVRSMRYRSWTPWHALQRGVSIAWCQRRI
ncbi:glycosyltransferase [Dyella silvae]|uniref:glycosyltransferase n=1 Tax=Dyella silvae TaxID=2994424 RepID=UPI0022653632|nr:glycosyltransferase [Dyella silvae]